MTLSADDHERPAADRGRGACRAAADVPRPVTGYLARSLALFVGLYSLVNAIATMRAGQPVQDLWWIDLRFFVPWQAAALSGAVAVLLATWGLWPATRRGERALVVAACLAVVAVAAQNTVTFYQSWADASFEPRVPIPFTALVALGFVWLAWRVWRHEPAPRRGWRSALAIGAGMVALAIVFPLAQIAFFGTSDYRTEADAAVVFGARVWSDGSVSPSLRERLDTAVGLYDDGLVDTLIMSGGVDGNGHDEAAVMARYAIDHGVPASAVLTDSAGVDTDATVANTVALFAEYGIADVLVVSQNYHLPRVKLAYRAAGWEVRTVPAEPGASPIVRTPQFIAREIPAFWAYWARTVVRDFTT